MAWTSNGLTQRFTRRPRRFEPDSRGAHPTGGDRTSWTTPPSSALGGQLVSARASFVEHSSTWRGLLCLVNRLRLPPLQRVRVVIRGPLFRRDVLGHVLLSLLDL